MALFKSALTIGSFTFISRILGYIRDILIAKLLGANYLADAFFVAFRLANFFRRLSAEGAFNAAFIPLFSHKYSTEGKESALNFVQHILSFMIIALTITTIVIEIFMDQMVLMIAPGFAQDPQKFEITVFFARIVFPYFIMISLAALYSGILNSFDKFAAVAVAPCFLNIVMIICLLFLTPHFPSAAHSLVTAVVIGGVIQLLWIMGACWREKLLVKPTKFTLSDDIKLLLKRMVPGIIGGGVTQISLWINTVLATSISGAVSYLYYADRLVQFPLAIIGTAMGTVLLPTLSKEIKQGDTSVFQATQRRALEVVLLLTIPAAMALFTIAPEIIHVMFERGEFTTTTTYNTAIALQAYSIGLPAFVMIKIFATTFFATGDTKTPVRIAIISLIVSVTTSVLLLPAYQHLGLAIATSLGAWVNTLLLICAAYKQNLFRFNRFLLIKFVKFTLMSLLMAFVIRWVADHNVALLYGDTLTKIVALFALIAIGGGLFFTTVLATRTYKLQNLKQLLQK